VGLCEVPGHGGNFDEFTKTISAAITHVGGARRGKAIIILNPAEPPLIMRDTVFALVTAPDPAVDEEIRSTTVQAATLIGSGSRQPPRY